MRPLMRAEINRPISLARSRASERWGVEGGEVVGAGEGCGGRG